MFETSQTGQNESPFSRERAHLGIAKYFSNLLSLIVIELGVAFHKLVFKFRVELVNIHLVRVLNQLKKGSNSCKNYKGKQVFY